MIVVFRRHLCQFTGKKEESERMRVLKTMTTRESIGGEEATKKEKGAIIRTKPFIA
jgi:hypothetical protein